MNAKIKLTAAAFAAAALITLTSCGDSEEQKELNRQYIATAKTNALNYIQDKYGFEPEITDAVQEREYGMFSSTPLTTVYVRMNYNNRNFGVYIDGASKNTDGYDNYQQEDLYEYLKSFIPEPIDMELKGGVISTSYDDFEKECVNMYQTYFDGTNIAEMFNEKGCSIYARYIDKDFSEISADDFPDDFFINEKVKVTFYSYRSEDAYNKKGVRTNAESAVYLESYCTVSKSETVKKSYPIGRIDNMYYYVEEDLPESVNIREITPDNPANWDNEFFTHEVASKAYSIKSDSDCTVWIYFPESDIVKKDHEWQGFAFYKNTDGESIYDCYYTHDWDDDYAITSINLNAGEKTDFLFVNRKNRK